MIVDELQNLIKENQATFKQQEANIKEIYDKEKRRIADEKSTAEREFKRVKEELEEQIVILY